MPGTFVSWVGRVGAVLFLLAVAFSGAGEVLFPEPRHFVRRITDPVSDRVSTIHEYCAGNRIVAVDGERTVVTDYGKQEVLEIDRVAGTYSVTRFDELARTSAKPATGGGVSVDVRVDRSITISKAAAEVLLGAAWPNPPRAELLAKTRISRRIATDAAPRDELHALPVEQTVTIDVAGERTTLRNEIIAVDGDRLPADAMIIPPGARRVESRAARLARELSALEP